MTLAAQLNPLGEKKTIPGLNGLRGVAALMVFAYHLPWLAGFSKEAGNMPRGMEWAGGLDSGVALFFTLSAFLLCRPFWRTLLSGRSLKGQIEPFLVRRFCRIFPAYWLVVGFSLLFDNRTWTTWGLLNLGLHLTGLQTHFHENFVWKINNVLWTVSVEIQFYLALALIFAFASRWAWVRNWRGTPMLIIFTVVFLVADPLYRHIIGAISPHVPEPLFGGNNPSWVTNWNFCYFLKWFLPGIWIGWLSIVTGHHARTAQVSRTAWDVVVLVTLLGLGWIVGHASEGLWRVIGVLGWPANGVLMAMLVYAVPLSRVFRNIFDSAIFEAIGLISYGFYLWHVPLTKVIAKGSLSEHLHGWTLYLAVGGSAMLVICIVSSLSYFLMENPIIQNSRHCTTFRELWKTWRKVLHLDDGGSKRLA